MGRLRLSPGLRPRRSRIPTMWPRSPAGSANISAISPTAVMPPTPSTTSTGGTRSPCPASIEVTLRRGEVEPTVGKYFAGGAPDLGVVIEVAGTVYGPSSVIRDSYRPIWDYTFPQPITWKLGDPITIRIIDYDWSASEVYVLHSRQGDPLAMRLLSGNHQAGQGRKDHPCLCLRFHRPHTEPARVSRAASRSALVMISCRWSMPDSSKLSTAVSHSGIAATPCWPSPRDAVPNGSPSFAQPASATASLPPERQPAESLFALPMRNGAWMIVGVHPLGCDDHDRPGALAFHALFLSRWTYWWAGADPFAFTIAIHGDWCAEDANRTLPTGQLSLQKTRRARSDFDPVAAGDDPRVSSIVMALTRRRRVVVQSSEPIDALAQSVWLALPGRVRRRVSVATWVFNSASHFDLVALPKLARIDLDAFDLILTHDHCDPSRDQAALRLGESSAR